MTTVDARQYRVAIVGAGFGGLGMAIRLKQSGIEDFVVFERDEGIGGAAMGTSLYTEEHDCFYE